MVRTMKASGTIDFAGVYAYCGHCYDCTGADKIAEAAAQVRNKTTGFAERCVNSDHNIGGFGLLASMCS